MKMNCCSRCKNDIDYAIGFIDNCFPINMTSLKLHKIKGKAPDIGITAKDFCLCEDCAKLFDEFMEG